MSDERGDSSEEVEVTEERIGECEIETDRILVSFSAKNAFFSFVFSHFRPKTCYFWP